jgi:DNA-binding transcriptional LysR family regulator
MEKGPYEVLDLKALRCFFFVAKHLNVTRAATELGIAGPAVTQRVQQLEKDLGVKLYETRGGRVRLTPAGDRTREFAISVFEDIGEFEKTLKQSEETGEIVLTAHDTYLGYLLPPGLEDFKRAHPLARIRLLSRRIEEIVRLLRDNEADVGVIPERELPPELFFRPIATYSAMFLTPKGHPLARRARADFMSLLNAETVTQFPLIVAEVQRQAGGKLEESFAELKLPLTIGMEVDSLETVKRYVAHGLGVSVVPQHCLAPEDRYRMEIIPVPKGLGATTYGIAMRRDKHRGPLLKHLLEILGALPAVPRFE